MAENIYGTSQAEDLIAILAHDNVNGKIVSRLIEPEFFRGDLREVAERLKEYWVRYGEAPRNHTSNLFDDILDDPTNKKARTFRKILENMNRLIEGINTKYVLDTLQSERRKAVLVDGVLRAAEMLNAAQLRGGAKNEETEKILSDLLRARKYEFDRGMSLRDIDRVVDFVEGHYSEFRLGIVPLDRRNVVPARGAVFMLLAATGHGKTWGLCHIGKRALMQRKRVLHITLEMGEEEVIQRYLMSILSISKRKAETEISSLDVDDETGRLRRVGKISIVKAGFKFTDPDIRKRLRKEIKYLDSMRVYNSIPDLLMVKRFPPRALTVDGIIAFLDAIEAGGFTPDMVILDYIGIMNTDAKNHRISLGRVMEEFRGVMVQRNMAGVTAHQISKTGAKAILVKPVHVAEDWSLIGTTDIAVTFSQTEAEKNVGLARLFVGKSRSEEDRFGVVITQSYDLGQWALQAAMLNDKYLDFLKDLRNPNEDEDEEEDK